MNLVADASALVGELLRARGRLLLRHPDIDWFATVDVAGEVQHELGKRGRSLAIRRQLTNEETAAMESNALALLLESVSIVAPDVYHAARPVARERIHDPRDWSTVALALMMEAGIWTEDHDFFGIGLPVWSTRVLLAHLNLG